MNLKKFDLIKKNAVITGGAGLLGYQHAIALMELGANVYLLDVSIKKMHEQKIKLLKIFPQNNIEIHKIDITKEIEIIKFVKKMKNNKKNIDILINNAAIDTKVKKKGMINSNSIETFKLKRWKYELDVGLSGTFLCCKHIGKYMVENRKGNIINIASDLSVISPDHRIYNKKKRIKFFKPITYSVIKTGIIGITKYIATTWGGEGIRCNALSPGGILNNQNKSFIKKVKQLIPMNRLAKKDEYRSAIQFLSSDASSYMNGHNLIIDGGRSVW